MLSAILLYHETSRSYIYAKRRRTGSLETQRRVFYRGTVFVYVRLYDGLARDYLAYNDTGSVRRTGRILYGRRELIKEGEAQLGKGE
jgi:hypothetical protein